MRFFAATSEAYEAARATLDAAWGLPNGLTTTCFLPVQYALCRTDGRALLGVNDEFCTWEPASTLLPQLIASGAVEEITEAEYQAAVSEPLQG
jgi:hypothetical protein